ncbi:MAG: NAD(P)-binding protein [Gammaproteobacteria bacterium]|nr:NAD(P)-binding protein [Gammaproteobacteria bacterium]
MATSKDDMNQKLTFRRFEDGDSEYRSAGDIILNEDTSYKCPTYVHRTPPCQGSCPSGEDIRGWLDIVRGIELPPEGMEMSEYAFRRSTDANPFPAMMGRVCPAPCEDGCNRNNVEEFVGINSVEHFIGDEAFKNGYTFDVPAFNGTRIAIIGGGPAGMAAAYQLRRKGYGSVIFDDHEQLGGMMRYGIPGYRTPREVLDHECKRILNMGEIEFRANTRVGRDVAVADLEKEYASVLWALGCKSGRGLFVDGWEGTPNCVSGVAFLEAFNTGKLHVAADKVVCVGGGDTSIDVVSVARRLGKITNLPEHEKPEHVIGGYVAHDSAYAAAREGAQVTLTSLFPKENMTAAEHEVTDALTEGVTILEGVMPIALVKNAEGRATALRVAKCTVDSAGRPTPVEGSEYDIEADLIVSAIGQGGDLTDLEEMNNGRGLIDADKFYQVPGKAGHFVCGDIVRPHLLTTAIGQASIAVDSIIHYLNQEEQSKRPKVDVHHFNLLSKLQETDLAPESFDDHDGDLRGTDGANFAIHNYEDRSNQEIISSDKLFLGHFDHTPRIHRDEVVPSSEEVLGHFEERLVALSDDQAVEEAKRCMSCGMCFECDNCVIFCPQDAIFRVKKSEKTTGRYVDTDYSRCVGCHICSDVCPTGYIDMALG